MADPVAGIPMPESVARRPRDHRGYPIPWFVARIKGKPDFRVVRPNGVAIAVAAGGCWICGEQLSGYLAFTIGPMCAVNRVTSEPPAHPGCALFAARACPFLTRPHMRRRENGLPGGLGEMPGTPILRNPGVVLVWITRSFRQFSDAKGGLLLRVGDPIRTKWFALGRAATRAEASASIDEGLPTLRAAAHRDGPAAVAELEEMTDRARDLLPAPEVLRV